MVYSLIEDGVNDEVVIDSPGAPNYGAWSSNAYGSAGYDVRHSCLMAFFFFLSLFLFLFSLIVEIGY
jgi:hypothetical protein